MARAHPGQTHQSPVLVIEPDDLICGLLRQVLDDGEFAVRTVPDGAAALAVMQQHQPAVILMDLHAPITDGWSFIEQYRGTVNPPASIIVLSDLKDAVSTRSGWGPLISSASRSTSTRCSAPCAAASRTSSMSIDSEREPRVGYICTCALHRVNGSLMTVASQHGSAPFLTLRGGMWACCPQSADGDHHEWSRVKSTTLDGLASVPWDVLVAEAQSLP